MEEKLFFLLMILPLAKGTAPGLFYWSPRLGLDLSIPTTESTQTVNQPNKDTIRQGLVVMIDGYQAGITVIALAAGLSSAGPYPHLSPISAYFYTNVYRWGLRYTSLIPLWLGGHGGNFVETHRTWRRRFYYMDEFIPPWLKKLIPYVKKEEWDKEADEFKRFKKYSEPAFGKHYRYPTKSFNNFMSELTEETIENLDISSNSMDG